MVDSGWAAPFLIYPNLPKHKDLLLFHEAAKDAYEQQKGAWSDPLTLTGYEFRMCVKLYDLTKKIENARNLSSKAKSGWVSRYCADMTTREIFYPQDYYRVKPYNRIFIWPGDVTEAVARMNLLPHE